MRALEVDWFLIELTSSIEVGPAEFAGVWMVMVMLGMLMVSMLALWGGDSTISITIEVLGTIALGLGAELAAPAGWSFPRKVIVNEGGGPSACASTLVIGIDMTGVLAEP